MTGVYQITCRSNGKRYVGSAFNIATRWSAHRRDLRAGRHGNPKLQAAWNKYGEADFIFETIAECAIEALLATEQFFIDFWRACEVGFNICPIAGSRRGIPQPESVRLVASRTWKGKKRPPETIERMQSAQRNRSTEWKRRIAHSKRKENGATRQPIADGKRKNMARHHPCSPETRRKMSAASFIREARKRQKLENTNAIL